MKGRREAVVETFRIWLESKGWTVDTQIQFTDVVAERDGELCMPRRKNERRLLGSTWIRPMGSYSVECPRRRSAGLGSAWWSQRRRGPPRSDSSASPRDAEHRCLYRE